MSKNKKAYLIYAVAICSLFFEAPVLAADIPELKAVGISSQVVFDGNAKVYKYKYMITNPATNTGEIEDAQLDISTPLNGIELSPAGLIIQKGLTRKGKILTISFTEAINEISSLMKRKPIPVGGQPPVGWSADITVNGTFSWGVDAKKDQIKPGQTVDGFVMESRGLPSIRNMSVRPDWILTVEGYVSEEDLEKSKNIENQITFYGKTVGPTAPPADFKPADFLSNLVNMKHEAASQGWVKDKGTEQSLDIKLDNAKKKIVDGDMGAAKNILNAFINEVEAQGCATYDNCPPGKHVTSEAYALLKYNAQYLIDNLK